MTAITTRRDEPADGISLLGEPALVRLTDDLAIVHDRGITVLGDDLAILHDRPVVPVLPVAPLDEERPPVLVDATGLRPRVVRTASFGVALAATALLASIPVALLAPEQASRTTDTTVTRSFGRVFIDTDCNGVPAADERLVGGQAVQLVRNGTTVATTWTRADGSFSFDGLRGDEQTMIRVVRRAEAPAATPVDPVDLISAGFSPDLPITLEATSAGGSIELALPSTAGACGSATPVP